MSHITIDLNTPAGQQQARQLMPHLFKDKPQQQFIPSQQEAAPRVGSGARFCLAIDQHTAALNQLMKGIKTQTKLKRRDRIIIAEAAALAGIPPATGKRAVRLTVVLSAGQRGADTDAYWKSLLDALVRCGMLVDDSRQHVELLPVEFARGESRRMFVELYDL